MSKYSGSNISELHLIVRQVKRLQPGGELQALQVDRLELVVTEEQDLQLRQGLEHAWLYLGQEVTAQVQVR